MSNQDDIIQLIKSISGQANVLTIPRIYIAFTRSHRAALVLSQSVYWSGKTTDPSGWFYKSYAEWRKELGLQQHATETCVKILSGGGWLETKVEKVGIRNTRFYRPVMEKIVESVRTTLADSTLAEPANVPKRKTIRFPKTEITNTVGADAPNGKKPRPRNEMFDVLADVCRLDPKASGGYIGKTAADLRDYSPADIRRWYSQGGWWYKVRCANMEHKPVPSLSGIAKTIKLAADSDKPKVIVVR